MGITFYTNASGDSTSNQPLTPSDIPNLDASKITTGTFGTGFLADNAVTIAKFQQIPADRLLGRSTAGNGNLEQIACTAFGRSLIDDTDAATGRTTLGLGTLATQGADNVAITGGSAALASASVSGQTLLVNRGGAVSSATAAGLNIEENGTNAGYVRTANNRASFDLKAPANSGVFRVTPSAAAFTHTIAATATANRTFTLPDSDLNLSSQPANLVYAAPDASTGIPIFRALVATDIPSLNASKITAGTFGTSFIADNSITFTKIQQLPPNTLIGKATAGSGNTESITCTTFAFSLLDDADAPAARATLELGTLSTQNANAVAITGGTASFSGLDVSTQTLIVNKGNAAATATLSGVSIEEGGAITGYIRTGNTRQSIDIKAPARNGFLRFTPPPNASSHSIVSPANASRTLTLPDSDLNLNSQPKNLVFASPTGNTGIPTFRALVAADIPSIPWSSITASPTTIAGYGITDAVNIAGVQTISGLKTLNGSPAFSCLNAPSTALINQSWTGNSLFGLQIMGESANNSPAFIGFHRPGLAARYFGLDTDNLFAFHGGSGGGATGLKVGPVYITNTTSESPLRVVLATPPANNAAGTAGDIRFGNDSFLYVCVATNSWRRVALSVY